MYSFKNKASGYINLAFFGGQVTFFFQLTYCESARIVRINVDMRRYNKSYVPKLL